MSGRSTPSSGSRAKSTLTTTPRNALRTTKREAPVRPKVTHKSESAGSTESKVEITNLESSSSPTEKDSPTTLSDIDIQTTEFSTKAFERLRMGYGITVRGEPAINSAFKLNPASVPLFNGVQNRKSSDRIICQTKWTKAFVDNHMSIGAAQTCFHLVAAEAHDKSARSTVQESYESIKYQYQTKSIVKTNINFNKGNLKAENGFIYAIREALALKNVLEKQSKLDSVFEEFGYFMPCVITLGGKVVWWSEFVETANANARSASEEVAASIKAKADLFNGVQVGVEAGVGNSKLREATSHAEHSYENVREEVIGGNTRLKASAWAKSVDDDPNCWDVIERFNVKPIWNLLDDDLRPEVEKVITASFKHNRLSIDKTYDIRNKCTKNFLSWRDVYYEQEKGAKDSQGGRIIITAPQLSAKANEEVKWKFVRSKIPDPEVDDLDKDFLRYGDVVYIQPSTESSSYLHASFSYNSPVSGREGQVSLRVITEETLLHHSDKWRIERSKPVFQDGHDSHIRNIDKQMRQNSYVQKSDEFRLCCLHNDDAYLASHDKTMANVKVVNKEKGRWRSAKPLQNIKDIGLAIKFREVILLQGKEMEKDDERADWVVVAD
ncbi:hypothetical protein BC938DRAFT_472640 [Jimgerdemannia flammicorona]|uniref:MACPF-like domain-containing protein n=1 Tax=Jimgerdemannia flammicorona TaxID=994334 RepID=A0A433Q5N6_9FUNG|nr:hypothetical protein BC938DRAFT_472640 [Jimgerdemannia flammicorona]